MGHRASYVVIENGVPAYHYAHWGALTTPEVVLAGPDDTLSYLRGLASHEGLLDARSRQAMLSGRDPLPFMVPDAEVARQLITVLSSGWSVDPGALFALATSDPPPGTDRIEIAAGFLRNDPPPAPPDARRALLEQLLAEVLASE